MISSTVLNSKKQLREFFRHIRDFAVTRLSYTPALASIILLVLSIFLWLVFMPRYQKVVLFFPGVVSAETKGEPRDIPRFWSREKRIRTIVNEILLGPMSVERGRVFSQDVSVNTIMYRGGKVFIDFASEGFIVSDGSISDTASGRESFEKAAATLRKGLEYNFPFIDSIVLTVDGQIPFEFPYGIYYDTIIKVTE